MNQRIILITIFVGAVAFYGCSGSENAATTEGQETTATRLTSGSEQAVATNAPAKEETPKRQAAMGSASECSGSNEVEVTAKDGAAEKYSALDWENLKSAFAERVPAALGADGTAIAVYLATREITPKLSLRKRYEELGEEGYVRVSFTNGKGGHPDIAEYAIDDNQRAEHRVRFALRKGKSERTISKANWGKPDAVGTASITYMSKERICGEFSLDDPWLTIAGSFDTPLHSTVAADLMQKGG